MLTFIRQSSYEAPQPNQQPLDNQAFSSFLLRMLSYGNFVIANIKEIHSNRYRHVSRTLTAHEKIAKALPPIYCSKFNHSRLVIRTLILTIFYLSFFNYLIIENCGRSSNTMRGEPNPIDNYYDCYWQSLRVHAPYILTVLFFSFWAQKGLFDLNALRMRIFNLFVQRFLNDSPMGEARTGNYPLEEDYELARMESGAGSANFPNEDEDSVSDGQLSWEDVLLINKIIALQGTILQKPRSETPCNDTKTLLESVKKDFDLWRQTKTTRIIPEHLWDRVFLLRNVYEDELISSILKIDQIEIEKEQQARRLKICHAFFEEMKRLPSWTGLKCLRELIGDINTSHKQLSAESSKILSANVSSVLLSLNYQAYKTFITITKKNHGIINADLPLVYSQQLLFILMRSLGVKTLKSEFPDFIDMHKTVFKSMETINTLRLVNRQYRRAIDNALRLHAFFERNNSVEAPHPTRVSPVLAENKKTI